MNLKEIKNKRDENEVKTESELNTFELNQMILKFNYSQLTQLNHK